MSDLSAKRAGASKTEPATVPVAPSVEEKRRLLAERLAARARRRYPLSATQQRLWLFEALEPGTDVLHIRLRFDLGTAPDEATLRDALADLATRHDTLRTAIAVVDGEPLQVISPPGPAPFTVTDLTDRGPDAEADALALYDAFTARPFDFATGPLWRAMLVRMAEGRAQVFVVLHHLIADGLSTGIFQGDLTELYLARAAHRKPTLPAIAITYGEYAERQKASADRLHAQLDYWLDRLAGVPAALELPTDWPRGETPSFEGAEVDVALSPELVARLRALARASGATLFVVLLAAFKVLLSRLSGTTDIVVGTPIGGRTSADLEPLIGVFINTLALRTQIDPTASFERLVATEREAAFGAYERQDLPFDSIVSALKVERFRNRAPVFQVMFNMIDTGPADGGAASGGPETDRETSSKFDLTMYVRSTRGTLRFDLVYRRDLFAPARMEEMLRQYVGLLEQVTTHPSTPVSQYSLRTTAARRVLPDPAAPLDVTVRAPSLASRFEQWRDQPPAAVAVADGDQQWSYGELDRRAAVVGAALAQAGVGPGEIVAVHANRSAMLVSVLSGIVRSGAAFCLLDPAWPAGRMAAAIAAARPALWIGLSKSDPVDAVVERALTDVGARRFESDGAWATAHGSAPDSRNATDRPDRLAYVGFTSGTTGGMKVIAGSEGPLTHFLEWHSRTFGLTRADRFSMLAGLGHDPLLRDVFTPLWIGATVVIPDRDLLQDPARLAAWFQQQRISVAHMTPQHARGLAAGARERGVQLPALRYVFFAGDVLTAAVLDEIRQVAPHATCVNFYGATETPQAMGWWISTALDAGDSSPPADPPLGLGIDGVQLLVVDDTGRPAGVGELGEIWIRTPFLTNGYRNDPALTAERFVTSPFSGDPADRIYRTGDLGRYRPDGQVEFVGRRDSQAKVRGFRVELGEVRQVIASFPGVREAAVIVRRDEAAEALAAFVVAEAGAALDVDGIRNHARQALPWYMVPGTVTVLDRLPLTPNGKIDYKALQVPQTAAGTHAPPESDTERQLLAIWESVLGVSGIGVTDGFFDIGGHSLAALRVFSLMEARLGTALPLSTLFSAPTVRQLAAAVDRARASTSARKWPAVVTITDAPGPPLVCVHSLSGDILEYRDMARWLGPSQPVIGVQATLDDDLDEVYSSVEATAAAYLTELKTVQPAGPYFLCGFSSGGIIALEMAQQLVARGDRVALLAIIDTAPKVLLANPRSALHNALLQLANVPRWLRDDLFASSPRDTIRRLRHRLQVVRRRMKAGTAKALDVRDIVDFPKRTGTWERFVQLHFKATREYKARHYPGHVALVRAPTHSLFWLNQCDLVWKQMADSVEIHTASGTHFTIVKEPHVRTLAKVIARVIEGAKDRVAEGQVDRAGRSGSAHPNNAA